MSAREYPVGAVRLFRVDRWPAASEWPEDTSQVLMVRTSEDYWDAVEGDPAAPLTVPPMCHAYMHPLVVIDPEDDEQVRAVCQHFLDPIVAAMNLRDGLRAFADPKPAEPQGLGAVVEDRDGARWVRMPERHNVPWCAGFAPPKWKPWSDIDAVRVLSEGVTA